MSNEERVQWTLGAIIKMKNAGIGDSQKLDKIKHKLENGKPIDSKEILYLREKFEELKENKSASNNSSSPTYAEESNKNQSNSKNKISLIQFALAIVVVGATLFIERIIAPVVYDYSLVGDWASFVGFIFMIIGGIVAVIGRSRRKKQHIPEPTSRKKITQPALLIILVGATLFTVVIIVSVEVGVLIESHPLFLTGIIIMIIGGIVAVIGRVQKKKQPLPEPKNTSQTQPTIDQDNEVISVLKMRFAKGEITKEEFDKMKKDLKD